MNKKSTETIPIEYVCSICGNTHKRFMKEDEGLKITICPLINEKIEKYRRSKKKNYLCANIFLECYKRKVNFFDLMYEVGYLTEMLMERNCNNAEKTVINPEMIIDYFAMELGCSPKDFIKNCDDTVTELLNLDWGWSYDEIFEAKDAIGFYYLMEDAESKYSFSSRIFWFFRGQFDTRLLATKEKDDQGKVVYRLYLESPRLFVQGRDCHLHFLEWVQLGLYGDILLAEEYNGELAKRIERETDLYWKVFSEKVSTDDVRFKIWIGKLKQQTIENRLRWIRYNNHYTTRYDDNTFELQMKQVNPESVGIIIGGDAPIKKEMRHLLFIRFGKEKSIKFVIPVEAEQATDLLSLESIIKDNILFMQQALQQSILQEKRITFADILVVNSSIHCRTLQHTITPYHGIVNILTKDNTEEEYHIYVGYCKQCRTYIMFRADYNKMLEKGDPLCVVWESDKGNTETFNSKFAYKSQSILAKKGYNVQASVNLSDEERQRILKECIDSNLVQTHDLLEFLNWLIKTREPMPNLQNAIAKWKRDIAFVTEYKKEDRNSVFVKSITIK